MKFRNLVGRICWVAQLVWSQSFDSWRYLIHSATLGTKNDVDRISYRILANYHIVEKGLALPSPRPGFGKVQISNLLKLIRKGQEYGLSIKKTPLSGALDALDSYCDFNEKHGVSTQELRLSISKFRSEGTSSEINRRGGVKVSSRERIILEGKKDFSAFAKSRHSIRNFEECAIDMTLVKSIVDLSLQFPSVCNRRGVHLYLVQDRNRIQRVLEIQAGARGFSEKVSNLFVVCADLAAFRGSHERNQPFIDGGIYLLNVLYSVHYHGLGGCPLNWSKEAREDRTLRSVIPISSSHLVIALIAFGRLPKSVVHAASAAHETPSVFTSV